jgi:hypothetical protein
MAELAPVSVRAPLVDAAHRDGADLDALLTGLRDVVTGT